MNPGCVIPGPILGGVTQLGLQVWCMEEDKGTWAYRDIPTSSKVAHVP